LRFLLRLPTPREAVVEALRLAHAKGTPSTTAAHNSSLEDVLRREHAVSSAPARRERRSRIVSTERIKHEFPRYTVTAFHH
jgi:hypothetical protein